MNIESIKKQMQPQQINTAGISGIVITLPSLESVTWLITEVERLTEERGELLSLEQSYSQQLGEMVRLCDVACNAILSYINTDLFPENEMQAAKEIMEYVEAVRPPEGSKDPEWVMHIIGPDDVIDCVSQFDALRQANQHNKAFAKLMRNDPSPNDPYCVALAKNKATESV